MASPESLPYFLSTICRDESYPPSDGPRQDYSYFVRCGLSRVRSDWDAALALIRAGRAPRSLGLYLHWPYCPSRCAYCFCRAAVPSGEAETAAALAGLEAEMLAFKKTFQGAAFTSAWLGGGTPTFMPEDGLDRLLGVARETFELEQDAQFTVETSPATLTRSKLALLLRRGVNRVTMGFDSGDDALLRSLDRAGQTGESARRACSMLVQSGVTAGVSVVCGLPGQTRSSFLKDLLWLAREGPSLLHVYRFDPRPQTRWTESRQGEPRERLDEGRAMMRLAEVALRGSGYASADEEAGPRGLARAGGRQVLEGEAVGASILGLGAGTVSHAFGSAWIQRGPGPSSYSRWACGQEEEKRGFVIRALAGRGRFDAAAFRRLFGADPESDPSVAGGLRKLTARGDLERTADGLRCTASDEAGRAVLAKSFYSPRLLRALMKGRSRAWMAFQENASRSEDRRSSLGSILDDRLLCRVFVKRGTGAARAGVPAAA